MKRTKVISIFGVDSSGAKTGKGTWVVSGNLTKGKLLITEVKPLPEKDPEERIKGLEQQIKDNPNSLWAFDFPFSLPEQFAKLLVQEPNKSWSDLAKSLKHLTLNEFKAKADDYCRQYGEPRRFTDEPVTFSALHRVNPNMQPMTYYGIRLLINLVSSQVPLHIPPLIQCSVEKHTTILEVHPKSTLLSIFDRQEKWWGYKAGKEKQALRDYILRGLQNIPLFPIVIDKEQTEELLKSHDALDSLVACWTGALWLEKPELYDHPRDGAKLQLEGWIWKPKPDLFKPSN